MSEQTNLNSNVNSGNMAIYCLDQTIFKMGSAASGEKLNLKFPYRSFYSSYIYGI